MAGVDRTAAAALFQESVAPQVIKTVNKSSVALQTLPVIPMGDKTHRMPVLAALPTGSWLAADQDVKPQSAVSWDKVLLTAEELAVIVPISEQVVADATVDVVGEVTGLIAQEFSRLVDAAVFFGTGAPTSWPTGGIHGIANTEGQTVASTADLQKDISDAIGLIEDGGYDVTDGYAGRSLRGELRNLALTNQAPLIFAGPITNPSLFGVPLAYPLGWDGAKSKALFVSDSAIVIGLRQDVTTTILREATLTGFGSLAEKDSIAVRAVMRIGMALANPVSLDAGARFFPVSSVTPAP